MVILFNPGHIMTLEHCLVRPTGPVPIEVYLASASPMCSVPPGPPPTPLEMLLEQNPFWGQWLGWGLMVVAMMLPKLITPIQFIVASSFKEFRGSCSLIFVLGYVTAWMLAGIPMLWMIMGAALWWPQSYLPALAVLAMAMLWQCAPWKQRFLNKGHRHPYLAAFGWAAHRDALWFGLQHGSWCVGAGWALMLFPMLLPEGHNVAMGMVTLVMLSEHLEHPETPRWRINFRLELLRQGWFRWRHIGWPKLKGHFYTIKSQRQQA